MKIVNNDSLAVGDITAQMLERRPLPIGRAEFDRWCERIITGSLVDATKESLRWTLATMLLHLGPTDSHKEDAYFIHALRVAAIKETANAMMMEIKQAQQERIKTEAAATALTLAEGKDAAVLENKGVQNSQ